MSEERTVTYKFTFDDDTTREIVVTLREPALDYVGVPAGTEPDWIRLEFEQCPNCRWSAAEQPLCPVARNLVPVNDAFCDRVSFEKVNVAVETDSRTYQKCCSLQEAVSSLMGLIMATSGCPHLDKLRPMVYTHLPFSSAEQTTYRAVSMYLMAQFFKARRGQTPDWELTDLTRAYDDIHKVNRAFTQRLRKIQSKDANLNAIVKLDAQADIAAFSISRAQWEELECVFEPYFRDG